MSHRELSRPRGVSSLLFPAFAPLRACRSAKRSRLTLESLENRLLLAAEVQGRFFDDVNGNGTQDAEEAGLPGWLAYLDLDEDGQLSEVVPTFSSTDVPQVIFVGTNTSELVISGHGGLVDNLTVTLDIDHSQDNDLQAVLISPQGTQVELFSAVGGVGQGFRNTVLDDSADIPITDGQAPFTGVFRPVGVLADFDGEQADGVWTLEITDTFGAFDGDLFSWSISLAGSQLEPYAISDANGDYSLGGLQAGDYLVNQVAAPNWEQTSPTLGEGANILPDGGFETGGFGGVWDESSTLFGTPICDLTCAQTAEFAPHSGQYWAWFGGVDPADAGVFSENGAVSQDLIIPVGEATLSFWFQIGAASGNGQDFFEVAIDDTLLFDATESEIAQFPLYEEIVLDASAFADGNLHTIELRSSVFSGNGEVSNFFLDDVSLISSVVSTPGPHRVSLATDELRSDLDFGNRRLPTGEIEGLVWDDQNQNGGNDSEPGLSGVTVFLDTNFNGLRDAEQIFTFSETGAAAPQETTSFPVTISGLDLTIIDADVLLLLDHPSVEDLQATLVSPTGTRVALFSGVGGPEADFFLTSFDDEADTSIAEGAAPFTGSFQPQNPLSAVDGEQASGIWQLEVTNNSDIEAELRGWALVLESGREEPSVVTDADGNYNFTGLTADDYTVIVETGGKSQSFPQSGGDELIVGGDFETEGDWVESSLRFPSPACSVAACGGNGGGTGPLSGDWWIWLGGYAGVDGDPNQQIEQTSVSQDVAILDTATELSFWLEIPAAAGTGDDYFRLMIDDVQLFEATDADEAAYPTYQQVTVDISAFADGDSHTVLFESMTFGNGLITSFFLDDVSLLDGVSQPIDWSVTLLEGEVAGGVDFGLASADPPPQVLSVEINAGLLDPPDKASGPQPSSWARQRSSIRTLVVTFDEPVTVTVDDLVLTNLGVDAANDPDTVIPIAPGQLTLADNQLTISFAAGDLTDGVYSLEILSTAVDANNNPLDGDGDGTGGDSYLLVGDDANRFYVMTADFNGDFGTSIFDFPTFAYWFGTPVDPIDGAPDYVNLNGDDGISIFDFSAFANAFGNGVVFPPALLGLDAALAASVEDPIPSNPQDGDRDSATQDPADRALPTWMPSSPRRQFEARVDQALSDAVTSPPADLESILDDLVAWR